MSTLISLRKLSRWPIACGAIIVMLAGTARAQDGSPPIVRKVSGPAERIEMTVNTSQILDMETKIPRAQVNNPDILELTPVGASQIQIHAKKTGVTQVNLWDEKGKIHAIDVVIYGDVKELSNLIKSQFPEATVRVVPTSNSVILTGTVDKPETVKAIVEISQDYYPKVIDNISVACSQQVMLHVKVMEVSRTKLRDLGFDFADIWDGDSFVVSSVSGLLSSATPTSIVTSGEETFAFGIVDGSNSFFGVLSALQRNNVAKLIAEPTLVTVSGRPAYFQSGGEIPVLIPQGLGNVSVEFRPFGTQIDFVPIVRGEGRVRLEVRPRVSEIDRSLSVVLDGSVIPGFRTRQVDTGVELKVGQTLAIAGLLQTRIEATRRGFPWLSDLPYLGVPFRRVDDQVNEIELLVMVRPEMAEALDPHEVPPCGPGENTMTPNDCQLLLQGKLEVANPACLGCDSMNGGCSITPGNGSPTVMPQGVGPRPPAGLEGATIEDVPAPKPTSSSKSSPSAGKRPVVITNRAAAGNTAKTASATSSPNRSALKSIPPSTPTTARPGDGRYNPPVMNVPPAKPVYNGQSGEPGLIGPTGYDVIN